MKNTMSTLVYLLRRAGKDMFDFISAVFAIPAKVFESLSDLFGYIAEVVGGEKPANVKGKFEKATESE